MRQLAELVRLKLLAFIVSLNLHRRHLNESQRAMVAARLANMTVGGREANSANLQNCAAVSQAKAAELLGVSTRSVASAARVRDEAVPELVRAGEMSRRRDVAGPNPLFWLTSCALRRIVSGVDTARPRGAGAHSTGNALVGHPTQAVPRSLRFPIPH